MSKTAPELESPQPRAFYPEMLQLARAILLPPRGEPADSTDQRTPRDGWERWKQDHQL